MVLRIFAVSLVVAAAGLLAGAVYGGPAALLLTAVLIVLEVSISFDNAVVNATIRQKMSRFWQRIFLTVGVAVAVFGMRLVFPLVIVGLTASLGPVEAVQLALEKGDPDTPGTYGYLLHEAHPAIAAFGGMFLLMLFLDFVFAERDEHGAMWAIGGLAAVLVVSIAHEVPEWITGALGLGFITAAMLCSVRRNRRSPVVRHAPPRSVRWALDSITRNRQRGAPPPYGTAHAGGDMDLRTTGRVFGWLFLGTFVTSIPARLLFIHGVGASWTNMHFVAGDTSTASLKLGAVLEFGLIVTQLGTAVVLYPVARRQSETLALGYVAARTMESVFTAIGLMSIISVVSVAAGLGGAGADVSALGTQGNSLVHTYEWAFEWGPGLVAGLGNGIILGYLMYRSALVPPRMALLGLIGGSLLVVSFVMILIGVYKNGEGPSGLLTLPEAGWELSLGIYCAVNGFRSSSPIARPPEPALAGRA